MTLTQSQADRIQAKWEDQIAVVLGIPPVTYDNKVVVLSQAAFDQQAIDFGWQTQPGQAGAGAGPDHTVYIPDTVSPETALRFVVYETAHGMVGGGNTAMGVNGGLTGDRGGKASEAISGVVLKKLGLQPADWTPNARQARFLALDTKDLSAVVGRLNAGNYVSINDSIQNPVTPDAAPGKTSPEVTKGPDGTTGPPTDTGAGGNTTPTKDNQIKGIATSISELMGGFLTGKYLWQDLDPKAQESVMSLVGSSVDMPAIMTQVATREPNASPDAMENDYRTIGFSIYLKDHFPQAYTQIRSEGIANGTLTAGETGQLKYNGVNQGDTPTLDPTFLQQTGGGKPADTGQNPDGTYPDYVDPRTGLTYAGGPDTNGDGIPDYLGSIADTGAVRTPLQIKNATATFSSYAANLGLDTTGNVGDLINKAAEKGWSVDRFQQQLYRTSDFQAAFPGIFNDQGGLKMTIAQYQSNALAYQDAAAAAGVTLTPKEQASLFSNDVSVAEATTRMTKEHTLRTNKAMFDAFNLELKAKGQPPLTKQGIFDFLGGQGNAAAVDIWNKAATDYAATQAGIKIGEGGQGRTTVPLGQLHKIASLGLSAADLASGFGQMAKALFDTVPMSEIQGKHALTASDIRQAVFGGPKQQKMQKKITRIVETAQAATQDTAHTQVSPTETGGMRTVGSNTQRAGSAF